MPRPMRGMLRQVAGRTSLHMPATGGRAPFRRFDPYRWDTTEIPTTDDLYHPLGAIQQAESLAARSAGAAAALMLAGGSTAGVHTMLLYGVGPGGAVVLPRNAHVSALNLCAVAGIEPVFAEPALTPEGRLYTTPESFARALDARPDAAAAFALHGDYYGLLCDLPAISRAAHARGKLLLCDEAHGAYFNWRADVPNAGACGADLYVQSAHKTLPALTSGAWLFAGPEVDAVRLRATLRMVQTSSPSFLTLMALDEARAWMDERGQAACTALFFGLMSLRARAAALGYADGQPIPPEGMAYDRLRLVLRAPEGGGVLATTLAKCGVDVEMSDEAHIVCILPLTRWQPTLRHLERALAAAARQRRGWPPKAQGAVPCLPARWPARRMPLQAAAFAPAQTVLPAMAASRISAAFVGLYPPGVAWLTPGDEITPEIAALVAGTPPQRLFGLTPQGLIPCVNP